LRIGGKIGERDSEHNPRTAASLPAEELDGRREESALSGGDLPGRAHRLRAHGPTRGSGPRHDRGDSGGGDDRCPGYVRVRGLRGGEPIELSAVLRLDTSRFAVSRARLHADSAGRIDVSVAESLDGTYTGIDPMGLFWSVQPDSAVPQDPILDSLPPLAPPAPLVYGIMLIVDARVVASARASRLMLSPRVTRTAVNADGLVGAFFRPVDWRAGAAVLSIGGSEGGLESASHRTMLLAAHGYAALALAYFRVAGTPAQLIEIPLEYFERALTWLRGQPGVDARRVAILGVSRGSEPALLLAGRDTMLGAVVAYAPSAVIWPGLDRSARDLGIQRAAWTLSRKPIPFARGKADSILSDSSAMRGAAIPVERSRAPILLVSGQDDQLAPSSRMAAMLVERAKAQNPAARIESAAYPETGHSIVAPYLPVFPRTSLGGRPRGIARADQDSWRRLLSFLDRTIGS